MSNIKEDVVKEELPVEVVETVLFPEETIIEEITQEAPAPQVEEIVEMPVEPAPLYKVRICHPLKQYRDAPKISANVIGLITDQGVYDVYEENEDWIKLDNGYWTMKINTLKL